MTWLAAALACAAALAAPGSASSHRLAIDPVRSEVRFTLETTWHKVYGSTKAVSGTLTAQSGDPFTDGRAEVEVKAAEIQTGNKRRDRTMREDHLSVAEHPVIRFASSGPPEIQAMERDPGGAARSARLTVPGDLTVRGVTRRIDVPITAERSADGIKVTGEVVVRLSDHGIPDPSIVLNRVQDAVRVEFDLWLALTPPSPQR